MAIERERTPAVPYEQADEVEEKEEEEVETEKEIEYSEEGLPSGENSFYCFSFLLLYTPTLLHLFFCTFSIFFLSAPLMLTP